MAEEAGTEEKETSTMGRVKERLKQLTGRDSDEEKDADGQPEGSSEEDGGSGEQAEAQAEGDSGEAEGNEGQSDSGGEVAGYSIDDVDLDKKAEDEDEARAQIKKLEKEGPPENLADWPTGKGMFLTFGGAEGEEGYEDGTARQMGPSSLRHHADGGVEIQGEMVDNPEDYKAEKSVTEEAEELGMDKGAKTEEDGSEDEDSSEDGAQAEASDESSAQAEGSDESSAQAEGSDESSAQSDGSSHGDGSGSEASEEKSESETSETS